jgi:hypothetical protein
LSIFVLLDLDCVHHLNVDWYFRNVAHVAHSLLIQVSLDQVEIALVSLDAAVVTVVKGMDNRRVLHSQNLSLKTAPDWSFYAPAESSGGT